jgi:DNA-binding response OmpR family regulator
MIKTLTALSVPHLAALVDRQSDQERRQSLRRLDDMLETLEQLNLHDRTELTDHAAERLVMLGIREPHTIPIPQLIEHVWAMQQSYLTTIVIERRRRQRRKMDPSC